MEEQIKYKTCIGKYPCTRFVYTFSFEEENGEKNFEELINIHMKTGKWKLCDIYDKEENELFEHIANLVTSERDNFNKSVAVSMKNIEFQETRLNYRINNINIKFSMKNIWMILFKTNIGFIIVDTVLDETCSLDNLVDFNYGFKSLKLINNKGYNLYKSEDIKVSYDRNDEAAKKLIDKLSIPALEKDKTFDRIQDEKILTGLSNEIKQNYGEAKESVEIENLNEIKLIKRNDREEIQYTYTVNRPFDYKKLFVSLIENIKIGTFFNSYYSGSNKMRLPSKAHVYTAAAIQSKCKEEVPNLLYWLRKGYKKSYTPDDMTRSLENNQEVLTSFNDSIWGVSREGVANIVRDDVTFLNENYHSRLDIYFYLYLLVLHQYYGLLSLSRDAAELSSDPSDYKKKQMHAKLKGIRERLNFFYLKCVFNETSHISHQSMLYKRMWDQLGVQNILDEIQFEIERIAIIIDDIRQEDEKKQKDQQEKRNKKFIIIAAIFTTISAFESIWSIFSMAGQSYENFGSIPLDLKLFTLQPPNVMLILTLISIVICTAAGYGFFRIFQYLEKRCEEKEN